MNINAKHIEELGGLMSLEIEPNAPDIPEIDGKEVTAYLFDGYGVAKHEDMYLFLTYPGIGNAMVDEQIRRTINQYRFGNRLPDNFKVTYDDLAMCYATFEEINHEEYIRQLMKGIFTNSKSLFKGTGMTAEKFREHNLSIVMSPCKHLYIFKDDREFLKELDGKIYAILDLSGNVISDVMEEDMITLEEQGIISNNQIVSTDSIEYVRSSRVEIVILERIL